MIPDAILYFSFVQVITRTFYTVTSWTLPQKHQSSLSQNIHLSFIPDWKHLKDVYSHSVWWAKKINQHISDVLGHIANI